MKLSFKHFNELSTKELYSLLQLRSDIFVVEQKCIYNDLDGLDELAYHLLNKIDDEVIGYARILPPHTRFTNASIGRLVVSKNHRFKGIARQLMNEAAQWISDEWQVDCIQISAQKYLKEFYRSLGYQIISDEYLEDGIPHLKMELKR